MFFLFCCFGGVLVLFSRWFADIWRCLAFRSQSLHVCELCACVSMHLVHIARGRFIQICFFSGARTYFMVSLKTAFVVPFVYKRNYNYVRLQLHSLYVLVIILSCCPLKSFYTSHSLCESNLHAYVRNVCIQYLHAPTSPWCGFCFYRVE